MKEYIEEILRDTEAVIFDFDGTLVDSMWIWKSVDVDYLAKFGFEYEEGLQQKIEGMSFYETALFFKENYHISDSPEDMVDEWNSMAYDKYLNQVPFKPGAKEFLDELIKRGIRVGIGTSNTPELVAAALGTLNAKGMINAIVTGHEVERGKPSPDIYLEAAKRLGVEPEKCLVFEDIVPGIMAAKNAGMRAFAVDDEYSKDVWEEKKKTADYYITDYRDFF